MRRMMMVMRGGYIAAEGVHASLQLAYGVYAGSDRRLVQRPSNTKSQNRASEGYAAHRRTRRGKQMSTSTMTKNVTDTNRYIRAEYATYLYRPAQPVFVSARSRQHLAEGHSCFLLQLRPL